MTNKDEPIIMVIDPSNKRDGLPEYDPAVRCPAHPDIPACHGFGLAGGGVGVYSYCEECGLVLTKSLTEE